MPITVSGGMSITGGLSTLDAPALSLDFMSGTLDSRITFSRGTQGTIVDSTGKLTYAPNNLLLNSQCDAGFVGNGTTPPTVTSTQVWQGISSTKITFTSSSAVGYAGSRADRVAVGSYQATVTAGYYYLGSNLISLSRALTGSESIVFYWTGTGGFGKFTITSANSTQYVNQWVRTTSIRTTPMGAAGTVYPVVFLNGALSSNLDVYICNGQCEQITYQTQPSTYVPTTTTAYYGPRFDYDPISLQPKGLLIESQRTNLMLQSENFTTSPWTATIAGTSTRTNLDSSLGFMVGTITATSANGGLRQVVSVSSGQVYTLSFYISSNSAPFVLALENSAAAYGQVCNVPITPSTGTFGTLTGFTRATSSRYGSGYLYEIVFPAAGGTLTANIEWRITNSGDTIIVGRPQFELGIFATSYIPTVASTVTRNADTAVMTGTNFSSWYNQSEGTFVASASTTVPVVTNVYNIFSANFNGSGNDQIRAFVNNGKWGTSGSVGGVVQFDLQETSSYTSNLPGKIAVGYKLNDIASCVNGATLRTDTVASIPTVNQLSLSIAFPLNGTIRSVEYYSSRLNNDAIQLLSRL